MKTILIQIIATNGIVLATEKKSSSPLIDPPSLSKVSLITPNIGMVYSGMGPDYRVLVDKARKVSHTGYKRIYNEYPPTRILVQDVARVMQEATQSGGVRPYGVSLLIAGWDEGIEPDSAEAATTDSNPEEKRPSGKTGGVMKGGPMLYQVDPSGSYFPWKATAIGKSATSAKTFLEKRYTEGLELEDAVHIALLTLKETIEGEMNGETVEIGTSLSSEVRDTANITQALLAHQLTICLALRELRVLKDQDSESSPLRRLRITLRIYDHFIHCIRYFDVVQHQRAVYYRLA